MNWCDVGLGIVVEHEVSIKTFCLLVAKDGKTGGFLRLHVDSKSMVVEVLVDCGHVVVDVG